MRPMRLAKREVQDVAAIHEIVDAVQIVHVGAIDSEGMFIVPMNYGYEWHQSPEGSERLSLYLHSAPEGRKAEAFSAGGNAGAEVAIELEKDRGNITGTYSCAFSRSYRSIMGNGLVFPVTDEDEKLHGLQLLMRHAAPNETAPRFSPDALKRVAVFRVDVAHLTAKERATKR